ncbi:hypothetical protein BV25DRAFT_1915831 [Artomyces pyxidatus]|uniref:Uncharacterized protein n=1 Tax=Artomyces pyxidatus TaxID=48021 RepID=A0ACB8T3X5_9AGAM|nr:hypothetical protein BV25DRAFT_1915831 [Artomyces pyxidatus]
MKHTLGFVASPRRFNVAMTRAKALLVVIGDPTVLSLDPLWRGFLNYIYLRGGWKGVPISWDPTAPVREDGGYDAEMREVGRADMDDFARRMEELSLTGSGMDDAGTNDTNVDQPWREVE